MQSGAALLTLAFLYPDLADERTSVESLWQMAGCLGLATGGLCGPESMANIQYSVHIFSPVGAAVGHFEMATDTGVCCSIRRVTWAPNGRYLMIGDSEGSVRILESDSWSPITVLQPSPITCWREDPPTILPGTVGPRITQCRFGHQRKADVQSQLDIRQSSEVRLSGYNLTPRVLRFSVVTTMCCKCTILIVNHL